VGGTARALVVNEEGYRTMRNDGAHAHQKVPHIHVHLLAGRPLGPMPEGGSPPPRRDVRAGAIATPVLGANYWRFFNNLALFRARLRTV